MTPRNPDEASPLPVGATGVGEGDDERLTAGRRVVMLAAQHPERARQAVELGLLPASVLDGDDRAPLVSYASVEVLERFLGRLSAPVPSVLKALGSSAAQILSRPAGVDPDSVSTDRLAVVFSDLEGFTAYTTTHGDQQALVLLAEHHRLADGVVRRYGGRIVKRMGDGLLIRFRRPDRAIRSAVELLRTAPEPLRLRCGVHFGEVSSTPGDIYGHHVNLAARVASAAGGDQVLVTAACLREAGELAGLVLEPRKRLRLKGIEGRVEVRPVRQSAAELTMVPGPERK